MVEVLGSHVGQLIVLEAKKMGYLIQESDEGIQLNIDISESERE